MMTSVHGADDPQFVVELVPTCGLCGSAESTLEFRVDEFGFVRCRGCGLLRLSPAEACGRFLNVGRSVVVTGRLAYSEWTASDRSKHSVIARVQFGPRPHSGEPAASLSVAHQCAGGSCARRFQGLTNAVIWAEPGQGCHSPALPLLPGPSSVPEWKQPRRDCRRWHRPALRTYCHPSP
jgi:hypothetical protein